MKKAYDELKPDNFIDDFSEISYCNDENALLFANGEEVYSWRIAVITPHL